MRVLFLTHRVPYAPNRGDRARAYHIIRTLAGRVDLEVVSLAHDAAEAEQADQVRALGARVSVFQIPHWTNRTAAVGRLMGRRPLTHLLLNAPALGQALQSIVTERPPDVVFAYCSGMARFALEPPLNRYPLVLDLVDVDSAKWAALARDQSGPMRWIYSREARVLGSFERGAALKARTTIVVNRREADLLHELASPTHGCIVPNGVDLAGLAPDTPPSSGYDVVFCGVMNYGPNVEGVVWFAREVWPRIRTIRPEARFWVVGADPVDVVRQLAGADRGITVTGTVPDVRPYLWRAAVSVAPLKTARGLQNKVLEALAAGLPVVVTPQVAEGLPEAAAAGCRTADAPEAFSRATLELLAQSPERRRQIARQAALDALSWERQLEPLYSILERAAS